VLHRVRWVTVWFALAVAPVPSLELNATRGLPRAGPDCPAGMARCRRRRKPLPDPSRQDGDREALGQCSGVAHGREPEM